MQPEKQFNYCIWDLENLCVIVEKFAFTYHCYAISFPSRNFPFLIRIGRIVQFGLFFRVFEVWSLCRQAHDHLYLEGENETLYQWNSAIYTKRSWKISTKKCVCASKTVEAIQPICYSIHNPILYISWINKKFIIFNYKLLFSIKITSCMNFGMYNQISYNY